MRKNNVTDLTKKVTLMILCAATMLSMAACGDKEDKSIGAETTSQTVAENEEKIPTDGAATITTEDILIGDNTQIPNPFTDCDTLADAAALAGFDIMVPDSVDGYEERAITAMENDMIQVLYIHGDDQICVRKAVGIEDGYSYSIGAYVYTQHNDGVADPESNTGMDEDTITALAAQVQ